MDSIEGQHILNSRGMSDLTPRGDAAEGMQAFMEHRPIQFSEVLSKDLSEFVPWVSCVSMCCFLELMVVLCYQWTEVDTRQRKAML